MKSKPSSASTPSFHTYLKPGALAQLRYSKITARSKKMDAKTLLALSQLENNSDSGHDQPLSQVFSMDGFPCFKRRASGYHTRCLQRKKLIAVTPFFSQPQS